MSDITSWRNKNADFNHVGTSSQIIVCNPHVRNISSLTHEHLLQSNLTIVFPQCQNMQQPRKECKNITDYRQIWEGGKIE